MQKLVTMRFALPAIVILTVAAIAIVALVLLTVHHAGGTAWDYPY